MAKIRWCKPPTWARAAAAAMLLIATADAAAWSAKSEYATAVPPATEVRALVQPRLGPLGAAHRQANAGRYPPASSMTTGVGRPTPMPLS